MLKLITIFFLIGGNCMAEEIMSWEYKSDEIDVIEVVTEAGPIEAIAVGDLVKIERTGEYDADKCNVSIKIEDKKLKLSAKSKKKCFSLSGHSGCKTGFKVTAPANKRLILKSGAGLIMVSGFTSEGEFDSGAGDIEFEGYSGRITAKSGAGTIKGNVNTEELDVSGGASNIDLKWDKVPHKGNVLIKTGAGDAILSFPKETKMDISYKTGAGSFSSEFGSFPESNFKIDFKSGAGDLNIKKNR